MDSEDLLGINYVLNNETKTQNETSIVVARQSQSSNHWAIPQNSTKPEDILLDFNNFDAFTNNDSDDIRNTRKHREVPVPIVETSDNPIYLHSSILDDRTFAPPPHLPTKKNLVRFEFMAEREANVSLLPSFEKVMHSGKVLSRISIKSLITKKWKEVFWIIYGSSCLIVFRTTKDYEEWLLNPYLSETERQLLIKFKMDFEKDLSVTGIRGYKSTEARKKYYRGRGMLYQFKIDSMTLYGPSLMGAFASAEKEEIMKLHLLLTEMMKKSILNKSLLKLSENRKSSSVPSFAIRNENGHSKRTCSRMDSRTSTLTGSY